LVGKHCRDIQTIYTPLNEDNDLSEISETVEAIFLIKYDF
jgi:hypothetical protein